MEPKVCTNCGVEKELTEYLNRYHKNRDKYYYEGQCRKCKSAKTKKWRNENAEKQRKYANEYYHNHKIHNMPKIRKYAARYRENNRLSIKEYQKEYRDNNIERVTNQRKINRKKLSSLLSNGYVAGILRAFLKHEVSQSDIPVELIDLKRIQIKIYRELQK